MGLKLDIENAFLKSVGDPDEKGNFPQLSQDISDSIIKFLQAQEFTIMEMKAIVKLDELTTTGDLKANVESSVQAVIPPATVAVGTGAASIPNPVLIPIGISAVTGLQGVTIPKLSLNKKAGQGGNMIAVGYAYIGENNPVGPDEKGIQSTKVKLKKITTGTK